MQRIRVALAVLACMAVVSIGTIPAGASPAQDLATEVPAGLPGCC